MARKHKRRGYAAQNERRDRRVPVSLLALIDGENFLVRNIGFGGMSVTALGGDLAVGDPVAIKIKLDTGKRLVIVGEVTRYDGLIQYGISFSGLTPEAFAAIEGFQTRARKPPSPTYR